MNGQVETMRQMAQFFGWYLTSRFSNSSIAARVNQLTFKLKNWSLKLIGTALKKKLISYRSKTGQTRTSPNMESTS